jgi:hypothetical protein
VKKKKQKSLRTLKNTCWRYFSEYIRKRGADEGGANSCITCGKLAHWTELHAGHFVSGRTNAVLFDERIVHPQCPVCNVWKGGNYAVYTLKMIDLYGREKVEEFLSLKNKIVKFTRSDMEDLIETYKGKLA